MSDKLEPKWKRFEKLVAKLQKEISPDAEVTLDDNIVGRRSGAERQIDISVRRKIGQFDILVVIDCKDLSRPVDVKVVEEFLGLVDDVGANKGSLVSSSGFSKAAKKRAKDAGVDIYKLVDAQNKEWHSYVAVPCVCDFRGFGTGQFTIGGSKAILAELAQQDQTQISIHDKNHKLIGSPLTLLWDMWNRRQISEEPGIRRILLKPDPIFVKANNGEFVHIEIIGEFEILKKLYFGELPLTKVIGFQDESTGKLVLPGNSEIIFDVIDTSEVERTWRRIPSLDALVVEPVLMLTAFDAYPSTTPVNPDLPIGKKIQIRMRLLRK